MGTELIVLSSDDEEDMPAEAARPRKRIKHSDADREVLVIESMPRSGNCRSPGDEDCVILDYDPASNDELLPQFQACEVDDLVVVAERGPVACRDFPHSRHTCAKFPFSTSSHEKHCQQCFCYVCEVPAPCKQWGKGKNSMDHCHAVAGNEIWNKLRSRMRSGIRNRTAHAQGLVARQQQITQPQMRTYTQPPLRVALTGGSTGLPSHTNKNTNVPLANQHGRSPPANRPPYFPSSVNMGLPNGSHGIIPAPGPVNMMCVGHSQHYPNVALPPATNRRPPFNQHNDVVPFTGPTTATPQTMIYRPASNPLSIHGPIRTASTAGTAAFNPASTHDSVRMAPTSMPRQGARHKLPPPQATSHISFLNTQGQLYQEQGVVGSAVAPSNLVGSLNMSTQGVCGFGKVRTGQSHDGQSTPLGMGRAEPSGLREDAHPSEGMAQVSFEMDTESLYDPLRPSEMPPCNNVMVGRVPQHQVANTLASTELGSVPPQVVNPQGSVQLSTTNESILETVEANRMITDLTPWWSHEPVGEYDDDFWMSLIEAALPRD